MYFMLCFALNETPQKGAASLGRGRRGAGEGGSNKTAIVRNQGKRRGSLDMLR
jgi:hypothetical protein